MSTTATSEFTSAMSVMPLSSVLTSLPTTSTPPTSPCSTSCSELAAALPNSNSPSGSGGVVTSIKVAMSILAVFFVVVALSFCLVGRKSNPHPRLTLPQHNMPPTFVARRKSLRSWLSTSSRVPSPHPEAHAMPPYTMQRPHSPVSLSGSTIVNVATDCPVVYPQAPPSAYVVRRADAMSASGLGKL